MPAIHLQGMLKICFMPSLLASIETSPRCCLEVVFSILTKTTLGNERRKQAARNTCSGKRVRTMGNSWWKRTHCEYGWDYKACEALESARKWLLSSACIENKGSHALNKDFHDIAFVLFTSSDVKLLQHATFDHSWFKHNSLSTPESTIFSFLSKHCKLHYFLTILRLPSNGAPERSEIRRDPKKLELRK